MANAISQHYRDDQVPTPAGIEQKIAIFADRVRGWQLDVAERLKADAHAGFAMMSILASYFEMIAKCEDGYTGTGKSPHYFAAGMRSVLDRYLTGGTVPAWLCTLLYEDVRCGMYHSMMTGRRVALRRAPQFGVIAIANGMAFIDPDQLCDVIGDHFSRYVLTLLDPKNETQRRNFEARFDAMV